MASVPKVKERPAQPGRTYSSIPVARPDPHGFEGAREVTKQNQWEVDAGRRTNRSLLWGMGLLTLSDPPIAGITDVVQEHRQRALIAAHRRMRPTAGGDPALHLLRSPTPRPGPRELSEPANRALPRIHNRITEATRLLLASPAREHGVEQRRLNPKRCHPLDQRQCRRARHTNLCHFAPYRHVMTHRGNRCNRTS